MMTGQFQGHLLLQIIKVLRLILLSKAEKYTKKKVLVSIGIFRPRGELVQYAIENANEQTHKTEKKTFRK